MSNMEKDLIREAKVKAARFCAYRERAAVEVRNKLESYGLESHQLEQVILELEHDGFLNEQRFAKSYASGKLRIKKWGRLKIKRGLEAYELPVEQIGKALESLPPSEYQETMKGLVQKKRSSLKESDPFVRNHKIAQFVISKGFEPDMVWTYLKSKI